MFTRDRNFKCASRLESTCDGSALRAEHLRMTVPGKGCGKKCCRALNLVNHGKHLNLDELLRLAQLEHRDVCGGRLVIERCKIAADHGARLADIAHPRSCPKYEIMDHVLKGGAGCIQRLLDAVHGRARLRLEVIDHVFLDLIALVRMVVIDRQRRGAGEPQDLSALDLYG